MADLILQGSSSGQVTLSAPADAGSSVLTLPSTTDTLATQNALGVRNLIINGDMRIDQRNAGASVANANGYILDRMQSIYLGSGTARWTAQQSTDAPNGFVNSFQCTVTTADASPSAGFGYSLVGQPIEGFNATNLGFGTANAKTITLSFWVKSSLTGSFPVLLHNSAANRAYGTTYTITSANTWEQKSVTITGDTSGTWLTNNNIGVFVRFGGGGGIDRSISANSWVATGLTPTNVTGATSVVGTNGATWYVTGVQLEVGDTATPFEHRPYDMELHRCQRYYWKYSGIQDLCTAFLVSTTGAQGIYKFPQTMRTSPTISTEAVTNVRISWSAGVSISSGFNIDRNSPTACVLRVTTTGLTTGQGGFMFIDTGSMSASAEL